MYFLTYLFPSLGELPPPKQDSNTVKPFNDGKPVNPKQILEDFEILTQDLHNQGFFRSNPLWFTYKFATTFAMLPLAYWLNLQGWIWSGCFVLAMMWQQFGWVSHEINHHSVFADRRWGHLWGWISGDVMLGFSMWWWNDRHNSHHAVTNIEDEDPDIETLPYLCFSRKDVEKCNPEQRAYIQYQHIYFFAILPFLNIIWGLNSLIWLRGKSAWVQKPERIYKDYNFIETVGITFHHLWLLIFLVTSLPWYIIPLWWFVCKMISGAGLAFVVFFNHYSCPKYDFDSDAGENFVINQLITTRNMNPGILIDWLCGGLNYQVEHHLWPTMPRHHFRQVREILIKWCADHNLPYLTSDFFEGLFQVRDFLKSHADYARQLHLGENKQKAH